MLHKRTTYSVLALTLGLAIGCSKESSAPAPAPAPPAPAPKAVEAAPTGEQAPPPGAVPTSTEAAAPAEIKVGSTERADGVTPENFNTYLPGLQGAVDQYVQDQKRRPASFEEVIRAGYLDRLPPSSKGKKYSIDPQSSQVKEVNQ